MNHSLMPFPSMKDAGGSDIRTVLRERSRMASGANIRNLDLLDALVEELRSLPWQFHVDHCHEDDGDLHLAVVATDLGRNLDVGDRVNAGFFMQNSERGAFATLACERLFRVACENGALLECEAAQSLQITPSIQINRADNARRWQKKLPEIVARSFSAEGLDVDLARFRATIEQMLVTPYELLCNLEAQGLISASEQSAIQAAFDDAADFSLYGLINAVTQVAHRLRRSDAWTRAFQIERLGGEILRGDHNLPAWDLVRT
jgi:hypothetical protein